MPPSVLKKCNDDDGDGDNDDDTAASLWLDARCYFPDI